MQAGDVVRVDFGIPTGSTPGFVRPAVVVNSEDYLRAAPPTVQVVPLTSNTRRGYLLDVPVAAEGLTAPSVAQCQLLGVVASEQILDDDLGNVGPVALRQIRLVLADLLDIGS